MSDVQWPEEFRHLLFEQNVRPKLRKEQDACVEYIYKNFQPLARLAWLQAYILRLMFDECIPRSRLSVDLAFKLAIEKDTSAASRIDTLDLKNTILGSLFYCLYESFLSAVDMAENGHFLVSRNALRLSMEAAAKVALLYNEEDRQRIIGFATGKNSNLNKLPDTRPYIRLKNMKNHLSKTASHANFETIFYASRDVINDGVFEINNISINNCYMDIFDAYFLMRDVVFDAFSIDFPISIIGYNKVSSAIMKDIKENFPYFKSFKDSKDKNK